MDLPEPCLVLDGSARSGVRAGVLAGGRWAGQGESPLGAVEGLFPCVEAALAEARLSLDDVRAFALCAGPGSVLGIRVAALAARTWSAMRPRPVFVWPALDALAGSALAAGASGPFLVAVESRLKRWHALEVGADGSFGPAFEAEVAQLDAAGLRVYAHGDAAAVFARRVAMPAPWSALPGLFARPGFLRAEPKPDAANVAQDFATWSGGRHRGS